MMLSYWITYQRLAFDSRILYYSYYNLYSMETYVTDRTHVWSFLLWIWPFKSDLLLQVSNICTELQINTNFTRQNYTQQSDINRRGAIFLYHISLHLGISPIYSISSISLITTYGCCTLTIFKYQEKQYIYIAQFRGLSS